ncbi:MAG: AAA family ATPase [Candidatus Thiodiazotropha sp. L084R]
MKVSKISIKKYRSCKSTEFSPHRELTTLIGPNGSGKTNILSAVKLLSSLLYVRRRARYKNEEGSLSTASEIKTWFDMDGKTIIHTAKINTVTNERNEDEVLSTEENWYMYQITGNRKKIDIPLEALFDLTHYPRTVRNNRASDRTKFLMQYLSERGFDEDAFSAMLAVVEFISSFSYYSASQFTNPANCPISFEVEAAGGTSLRRGISIRSHHKALLYDMYDEFKEKSKAYSEFISIVGPDGIGLIEGMDFNEIKTSSSNVSVLTGGRIKKQEKINLLIVPRFSISDNMLSPSQLSEGTFKALALIFYLITDKSTMLMIEEPEVCIHHGLLNSIIELINIYSDEKQIFISTHSDTVLDSIDIQSVFAVKRTFKDGTTVKNISRSLKKNEMTALRNYLATEGSLGEYWKHGDLENV